MNKRFVLTKPGNPVIQGQISYTYTVHCTLYCILKLDQYNDYCTFISLEWDELYGVLPRFALIYILVLLKFKLKVRHGTSNEPARRLGIDIIFKSKIHKKAQWVQSNRYFLKKILENFFRYLLGRFPRSVFKVFTQYIL